MKMKKIAITLFAVLLVAADASAQKAFEKGNFIIGLGAGISGYATKSHFEYDMTVWNGSGISTIRMTEDTTDGAVAKVFPLSLEYGVTNWLGIGLRGSYHSFFTAADSTNSNVLPKVKSFDGDLVIGLHFVKTKRFDMPLNISAGISSFSYRSNDPNDNTAKDVGTTFGVELNPRIYFGDHIGMYFNVGYASVSYRSMTFSNSSDPNLNDTDNRIYQLKGSGLNLGLGLLLKF
jgi:hypothetical protein